MTEHADPFFERWAERQRPPLRSHRRASARIEHGARHDELAAIDAELDVLCARRRAAVHRLGVLRSGLWPSDAVHHHRRPGRVDEIPMPPAPPAAIPLGGVELRATCLGILRRQGACGLRELHGLLHRHGYRIEGERAVQGLADAMAYEVRQGRAVRIARGVYGAVADGWPGPSDPLEWDDPDVDRPQLDPVVLDDPERWSAGEWPDPPEQLGSQVRPPDRYDPSSLDDAIATVRQRAADLATRLQAERSARRGTARPDSPTAPTDPPNPSDAPWDRFVDESVPIVRTWAQRRRRWGERSVQRGRRREDETAWQPGVDEDEESQGGP